MSQENVEIVRRGLDALNRRDFEGWFAITSRDIELYPLRDEPGVLQVYRGRDGLMEWMGNWYGEWDEYEGEPVEVLDAGDQVVVVMHETGRVARVGLEVEQDFSHSFRLRHGLIVEWRMHESHRQALEAVGLSE